ncbi:unnamed protein product, partial [Ectocarpus sp. 4 AP-2014]
MDEREDHGFPARKTKMAISRKQMQQQQSRSTTRRKDRTIRIDLSQCKYGVVKACARDMGWSISEGNKGRQEKGGSEAGGGRWDVYWTDTSVSLQRVMRMRGLQKINHFPGMCAICRKGDLARSLSRMQREFPEEYAFFPRTWVLPADKADFKEEILTANARKIKNKGKNTTNRKNNVNGDEDNDGDDDVNSSKSGRAKRRYYIVKPVGGCQGKDIFLTSGWKRVSTTNQEPAVAQRYVSNPLLIDGYKCDLRVYVLVTSVCPLRVMLHKRGLVRLCTSKYRPPRNGNLRNTRMHLTNYAINKGSENFVPPTGAAGSLPRTETTITSATTAATTAAATDEEEEDEDGDDGCAQAVAEEDEIHVHHVLMSKTLENIHVSSLRANDARSNGGSCSDATAEGGYGWTKGCTSDGDDGTPRGGDRKEEGKRGASKRSLEWFFGWLEEGGRDSAALWREVADLVVKTLVTAQPSLERAYCACFCGEAREGVKPEQERARQQQQ